MNDNTVSSEKVASTIARVRNPVKNFTRKHGLVLLAEIERLQRVTPRQARIIANFAHATLHILDDWAEENAQTGEVTIEIPACEWKELNRVLDLLGDDPHGVLHDAIGVNEPDRNVEKEAPAESDDEITGCCAQDGNPICSEFLDPGAPDGECVTCSHQRACHGKAESAT